MFKDKRILYITHTYNSFIKDPVEEIAKHFKKVTVLVRYQPIAELYKYVPVKLFKSRAKYSKDYSVDLTNLPDNVEVVLLPLWYLPISIFYYWVGVQHALKALQAIRRRKINFDLVHAHFGWSAGYAGTVIKKKYSKPLVITGHGYDVYDMPFRSSFWTNILGKVYREADKVTTVSESNKKCLEKIGVTDVTVLTNGYIPSLFFSKDKKACRSELNLPQDRQIILTVGNIEKVKGYEYLAEAISLVRKQRDDILCIHIGQGSLESMLKEKIEKSGLKNSYILMGRIPHHKLVTWYGACDLFVSSSTAEGNPTVLFETLGCGRPFVGTRVGGVPEIIHSEEHGLLCEPANSLELAKNILRGLSMDWNEDKILRYADSFSWKNIVQKQLEIYKELL